MMTLKFFFLRGVGCPRNPPWSSEAQTCPGLAVIQDPSSTRRRGAGVRRAGIRSLIQPPPRCRRPPAPRWCPTPPRPCPPALQWLRAAEEGPIPGRRGPLALHTGSPHPWPLGKYFPSCNIGVTHTARMFRVFLPLWVFCSRSMWIVQFLSLPVVESMYQEGKFLILSPLKTDCLSSLACAVQKLFHPLLSWNWKIGYWLLSFISLTPSPMNSSKSSISLIITARIARWGLCSFEFCEKKFLKSTTCLSLILCDFPGWRALVA